jgi:hypothetical protein
VAASLALSLRGVAAIFFLHIGRSENPRESEDNAFFLQNFRDLFDARVRENFPVKIQGRTFAFAGFFLHFGCEVRMAGHISDFKRNIKLIQKTNNGCGPRATRLFVENYFHATNLASFNDFAMQSD